MYLLKIEISTYMKKVIYLLFGALICFEATAAPSACALFNEIFESHGMDMSPILDDEAKAISLQRIADECQASVLSSEDNLSISYDALTYNPLISSRRSRIYNKCLAHQKNNIFKGGKGESIAPSYCDTAAPTNKVFFDAFEMIDLDSIIKYRKVEGILKLTSEIFPKTGAFVLAKFYSDSSFCTYKKYSEFCKTEVSHKIALGLSSNGSPQATALIIKLYELQFDQDYNNKYKFEIPLYERLHTHGLCIKQSQMSDDIESTAYCARSMHNYFTGLFNSTKITGNNEFAITMKDELNMLSWASLKYSATVQTNSFIKNHQNAMLIAKEEEIRVLIAAKPHLIKYKDIHLQLSLGKFDLLGIPNSMESSNLKRMILEDINYQKFEYDIKEKNNTKPAT
jgi:hypothetical protein